jgi:small subunit ribosomal protein S17
MSSMKTSTTAKAKDAPASEAAAPKGTKVGTVESDKRSKTRKVVVSFMQKHPKYGKYVQNRTVLHIHDENNDSRLGDIVEVAPCRPISKTKSWKLVRIVERRGEVTAALASAKEVGL